ncbi:MAG: zinc ribbon domain-containing protein [Synechococcales cyanobacterium T60_A2020_003]|nr:zinc ribbon domain-containing protein [Synechococcales cyanobacterium T60_A2020_003]
MLECPRCHHPVEGQAIACPQCQLVLKAHGHPGIPLYRSTDGQYLCQTCLYDHDETCTFPQRPYATECTLYTNPQSMAVQTPYRPSQVRLIRAWLSQHLAWIVLAGIAAISLGIAIANQ